MKHWIHTKWKKPDLKDHLFYDPLIRHVQNRQISRDRKLINGYLGPREEKAMAPHSSPLAWKIPWMEEPGGLQSMGLRRVGHD